ncbi:MAG: hypothetical protein ACRCXK_12320 [Wohlfahrtiimonas sp.]
MLKKSLIGLVVITALSGGGYFGYLQYQDYQAEQKRLRKEASDAMYEVILNAPIKAEEARVRQEKEEADRKQRIEAGTAKVERIEEPQFHGGISSYTLIDGKKEGEAFSTYPSGRKETEVIYKDGRSINYIKFYDRNGSPKKNEAREGPNNKVENLSWYEDGQLKSQYYVPEDGSVQGTWGKGWHPDGTLSSETKYNPETKLVEKIAWYPDGTTKLIETNGFDQYRSSVRTYKRWYPNGQQEIDETTRGNRPDGRVYEWNEKGDLITNEFWVNGHIDREQSDPKMIRSNYK